MKFIDIKSYNLLNILSEMAPFYRAILEIPSRLILNQVKN